MVDSTPRSALFITLTMQLLYFQLLSQETLMTLGVSSYGLVVELDSQGQIIRSLHDPHGSSIPSVSSVIEDPFSDGTLLLGSYDAKFIGYVKI